MIKNHLLDLFFKKQNLKIVKKINFKENNFRNFNCLSIQTEIKIIKAAVISQMKKLI